MTTGVATKLHTKWYLLDNGGGQLSQAYEHTFDINTLASTPTVSGVPGTGTAASSDVKLDNPISQPLTNTSADYHPETRPTEFPYNAADHPINKKNNFTLFFEWLVRQTASGSTDYQTEIDFLLTDTVYEVEVNTRSVRLMQPSTDSGAKEDGKKRKIEKVQVPRSEYTTYINSKIPELATAKTINGQLWQAWLRYATLNPGQFLPSR